MDQILMQQQLSFDHKMSNITQTNNLLDQLERKMNSYFAKPAPQSKIAVLEEHGEKQQEQEYEYEGIAGEDGEGLGFRRRSTIGNVGQQRNQAVSRDRRSTGAGGSKYEQQSQQLQFKIYQKQKSEPIQNNHETIHDPVTEHRDRHYMHVETNNGSIFEGRKERERLSQTTVYKLSNVSEGGVQNRSFKNGQPQGRKNNEEFRLLGKSKSQMQTDKRPPKQPEWKQNTNISNFEKNKNSNAQPTEQQYLRPAHQNQKEPLPYQRSNNNLIHSMQTVQIVMKEALDARLRKIKQIEHEIMTENEERVYLYKVNVRLNEELRCLEEEECTKQAANDKNIEWTIKTLEEDIEKLRKQIAKKKNQRAQLRKQQKTMRDGYQTVLNNKKTILRKDIQMYVQKQNKNNQNTEMLKGLMKELDKLKGVVQAKIRSTDHSGVGEYSKKRKVVKSFKN